MEINYLAVLACGVLSMAVGFIWYGPLFGKTWLKMVGAKPEDMQARKDMQKKAGPLYGLQFLLTLLQAGILAFFINIYHGYVMMENSGGSMPALPFLAVHCSLLLYAAFILPIVAGNAMWNNESRAMSLTRFGLGAGYQLVLAVLFGLVLGYWP